MVDMTEFWDLTMTILIKTLPDNWTLKSFKAWFRKMQKLGETNPLY